MSTIRNTMIAKSVAPLLLVWLVCPSPMEAAWAEVAGQRATASGTTLAFPNNVTSGNLLVVLGADFLDPDGPTSVAVTDTLGTSYTVVLSGEVGAGKKSFIAFGVAPSSGANTITVTPDPANTTYTFSIDEFSGPHATPASVDGDRTIAINTTTVSDSITTIEENELILGVITFDDQVNPTITEGVDYTEIGANVGSGGTSGPHHAVFRIVTTAQAYTVDWSSSHILWWHAQTYSLKPAIAASTAQSQFLLLGVGP
jgi:hypothetical protein